MGGPHIFVSSELPTANVGFCRKDALDTEQAEGWRRLRPNHEYRLSLEGFRKIAPFRPTGVVRRGQSNAS